MPDIQRFVKDQDREALQRGVTALHAGDLAEAERLFRDVLRRVPGEPDALNLLGSVAFACGKHAEAEVLILASLEEEPHSVAARFNLGRVYEATQRLDEAAGVYAALYQQSPGEIETVVRLGVVRYTQGRLAEAAQAFETVLRAIPAHLIAGLNLGIVYNNLGRFQDSVRVLRDSLGHHPDSVDAYRALADSLYELHRAGESAEASRAALQRAPDDPQALVLLGQAECERGDFESAESLFHRAAACAPDRPEAEMNLGVLMQRLGRIDEAVEHGRRAVAIAPELPLAHFNLAQAYLLAGDYRRGWPEFEWRMRDARLSAQFPYLDRLPVWDGEPMPGRDVLIALEQGAGDFVLFSRFFASLKAKGVRLAVEMPAGLAELYEGFPGIDELIPGRCAPRRIRSFAAHLPICSIPWLLRVEADTIPSEPYLRADPARIAAFRRRFDRLGKAVRVGIAWAGSPEHLLDRYRSCRLAEFNALAGIEGIAWVSLQQGPAAGEIDDPNVALRPLPLGPELASFADTAAAIEALDLVISVDTSVAHVAAATGKPVWTLHGFGSFWLWQLERSDSPWYPSMRLFRQHRPNSWPELFADVGAALRELVALGAR